MIKQMAIVKRKPGMTHREYLDYIEHVHGVLSKKYNNGTLVKYVQNHIYDGAYGQRQDKSYQNMTVGFDSVTELYFESIATMAENFQSPDVVKYVSPDGANFADESLTIPLVVEEQEVSVDGKREGGMKVIYYLKKAENISTEEYWKQVDATNREILPTVPGIFRYVKNIPAGEANTNHFNSGNGMTYEGAVSLWADHLGTFREYQEKMEAQSKKSPFFDPSYSFFVCCDEVYII